MVYSKKCVECGKLIDFGGEEKSRLPKNAIEFNGDIYCRECVKKFVEFGTGDLIEQVRDMQQDMEDIKDELGIQKH